MGGNHLIRMFCAMIYDVETDSLHKLSYIRKNGINNEETVTPKKPNDVMVESKGRARLLVYRFGIAIPLFIE